MAKAVRPESLPQPLHQPLQCRHVQRRHLESPPSARGIGEGAQALATGVEAHQQRSRGQLARGLLVAALGQRVSPVARSRHQVVEAQRHAKREVVKAAQDHAAGREDRVHLRPLHLVEGVLVGGRQLPSPRGEVQVARPVAHGTAGEGVPGSAAQAPERIARLLGPVRKVRELHAPQAQFLAHRAHLSQRLAQLLVPGEQPQQLA